jgi:hypothetical protein
MREFDFIFVVIVISGILFLLQIVIMEKKLELYADDLHIAIEGPLSDLAWHVQSVHICLVHYPPTSSPSSSSDPC